MDFDKIERLEPTPDYLKQPRFEKPILFAVGAIVGAAGTIVVESTMGLPMSVFIMAIIFVAGYALGKGYFPQPVTWRKL